MLQFMGVFRGPLRLPPAFGGEKIGGAEFAGPENDGPKKIKDWKMQNLENDGPNLRAGKCRIWKMTDQIAWLENAGPGKWRTKSRLENAGPGK